MAKKDSPLSKDAYKENARIYKILANPKRLEILNILAESPSTVDDLTESLGIRKANVSQHLSILRMNKLVNHERDGKNVIYKIVDASIVSPCKILHKLREENSI